MGQRRGRAVLDCPDRPALCNACAHGQVRQASWAAAQAPTILYLSMPLALSTARSKPKPKPKPKSSNQQSSSMARTPDRDSQCRHWVGGYFRGRDG